ncbi:DNA-directed DNA polymerase [Tanacetum coccineum]
MLLEGPSFNAEKEKETTDYVVSKSNEEDVNEDENGSESNEEVANEDETGSESSESDDSEDSDYIVDEDNVINEVDVDMQEFYQNIDKDVEWVGPSKGNVEVPAQVDVEEGFDLDDFDMDIDCDSDVESSKKRKRALRALRKESKNKHSHFYVGQEFADKKEATALVSCQAVETRRQLYVWKNDKLRVKAVCRGKCPNSVGPNASGLNSPNKGKLKQVNGKWIKSKTVETSCSGQEINKVDGIKIKVGGKKGSYVYDTITCPWSLQISKENNTWTVKTYKDEHTCLQTRVVKRLTDKWLSNQIEDIVKPNPGIPVNALKEQLQKKYQVGISTGKVKRARAASIMKVKGVTPPDGAWTEYVSGGVTLLSISSTKHKERPLRGQYPGQLLTAIGIDANHGIYPLAYSIVETENTSFWSWFLTYLGDDLGLNPMSNFTFISDRQKGYPSRQLHKFFLCLSIGKSTAATIVPYFDKQMGKLKNLDEGAYEYLQKIPLQHWSRSHFSDQLLDGRDVPIITCLEFVMEYLMKRIVNVKKVISKSPGPLTPAATKLFEAIKNKATFYTVLWNGGTKYQTSGPYEDQCDVDIEEMNCSCRKRDLLECLASMQYIDKYRLIEVFIEHEYTVLETYFKSPQKLRLEEIDDVESNALARKPFKKPGLKVNRLPQLLFGGPSLNDDVEVLSFNAEKEKETTDYAFSEKYEEDVNEDENGSESNKEAANEDETEFYQNIDKDIEWVGSSKGNVKVPAQVDVEEGFDLDDFDMDIDCDSDVESSKEKKRALRALRKESKNKHRYFYVGQEFADKKEATTLVDGIKINVGGKKGSYVYDTITCPWSLQISKENNTWTVKTYKDEHTCLQTRVVKRLTDKWLSNQIEDIVKPNPGILVKALKEQLQKKYQVGISTGKVKRARAASIMKVKGDFSEQYSLLRDYVLELQRTNEDTTVKIDLERDYNPNETTRQFKRIYVCIGALKRGFKEGLRDLLGLDGCFIKGQYPGQLLTAVGIDANHGILPAIATSISNAKHRRYLHNIGRAHCGVLLNNLCEVFNRQLVDDRDVPIITCLEFVRENLMKRIVNVKSGPYEDQCVVDIEEKTCNCRKLELTRMPCKHALAVINDMTITNVDVGVPDQKMSANGKLSRAGKSVTCGKLTSCKGIVGGSQASKVEGSQASSVGGSKASSVKDSVSYKWLSRNFLVPSNTAKRLLQEFVEKNGSQLKVIYSLSGWLKNNPEAYHVKLVLGSKLSEAKEDFGDGCSVQVYSVQASVPKDPAVLWNAEFIQSEELFKEPSNVDNCLRDNRFCGVSNSFVKRNTEGTPGTSTGPSLKNVGIPGPSKSNISNQTSNSSLHQEKKVDLSDPKPDQGKIIQSGNHKEQVPQFPNNKKKAQNDKSSSGTASMLASMWGRASAKPKPEPASVKADNVVPISNDAQVRANELVEDESSDDDASEMNFKRGSNGEGNNRKRRVVLDYSDEDDDNGDYVVNLASPDPPKKQRRRSEVKRRKGVVSEEYSHVMRIVGESAFKCENAKVMKTNDVRQIKRVLLATLQRLTEVVWEDDEKETKSDDNTRKDKCDANTANNVVNSLAFIIPFIDDANSHYMCPDDWVGQIRPPAAAPKKSPAVGNALSHATGKAGNKKAAAKDPKQGNIMSFFKKKV